MNQNMRTHKLIKGHHLLVIAALLAGLTLMPDPAPAKAAAARTSHSTVI